IRPSDITLGAIEVPSDMDLFEFVATETGRLPVELLIPEGSRLVPTLVAFDAGRSEIARSGSQVRFNVTKDRRYFLRVAGYGVTAGSYRLAFGSVVPDDFGSDFASATPLSLSDPPEVSWTSGSPGVFGMIEEVADADVFRVTVAAGRRLIVVLAAAEGSTLRGDLRIFTVRDGLLTQVASNQALAGASTVALQVDAETDRAYFVRVAASGPGSGGYRLTLETRGAAAPPIAIREAGKATFDQLQASFIAEAPRIEPTLEAAREATRSINEDLVRAFLGNLKGPLQDDYLLVWLDPVDFRLSDRLHRNAGYTADEGAINEFDGSYYSGNSVLQLLVIPRAYAGKYTLELIGVGPDPVLYGAQLLTRDGRTREPRDGAGLPVKLGVKGRWEVILDFSPRNSTPDELPHPGPSTPPVSALPPSSNPPVAPPGGRRDAADLGSRPSVGPPRPSPGRPGGPGSSAPGGMVTAGLVAALESQLGAGGRLPAGSTDAGAGGSAAAGGAVLTVVPVRYIPAGQATPGPAGQPGPGEVQPGNPDLSSLFRFLWDASEPWRRTLSGTWEAILGAVAPIFAGPETAAPAGAGARAEVPRGAEVGGEHPGGQGPEAAAGQDGGGGTPASVAALVAASALGILRAHRTERRAQGRAIQMPTLLGESTRVPAGGRAR
ncbi:MAG TPA: hypothetical protein VF590_21850, partial [Isosphaeraceae bacterium]